VLFVVLVVNAGVKLELRCESGADVNTENRAWRKSVVVLLTYPGCAVWKSDADLKLFYVNRAVNYAVDCAVDRNGVVQG